MRLRYRIAENEWNLKGIPWWGAVGIEDVEDDRLAVPPLVCWFTRGSEHIAAEVVDLLNGHDASQPEGRDNASDEARERRRQAVINRTFSGPASQ